jgi:hypothetical protein
MKEIQVFKQRVVVIAAAQHKSEFKMVAGKFFLFFHVLSQTLAMKYIFTD